jgi:class 3 adenylate cyclase
MTLPEPTAQSFSVTSLEHVIWPELHARLEAALVRQGLVHFIEPSMLILHDLIDCAVKAMQRKMFWHLAATDFGLETHGANDNLEALYQAEVQEHGEQNIARYCIEHGWQVRIEFPAESNDIVRIVMPVAFDRASSKISKLVDALWFELCESGVETASGTVQVELRRKAGNPAAVRLGGPQEAVATFDSVRNIYDKLGYGVILFSSAGEVLAVSKSMLERAGMALDPGAVTHFFASIPFNFYNDIIWGLALDGPNGTFENYRIRVKMPGGTASSILFNVSGYRDEQAVIHSLWQIVSMEEGSGGLSEGSILSEVRLHKITRNYVPQLVEAKAREAVRMGADKLTNEECRVAVLFCDIVGFTSYVENHADSESVINTLNTILRRVSRSIKLHHGSIDKFMGDCVMAIFRDPADAVYAALDMQSHSTDINTLRSRAGQDNLRLRIGIHWGDVVIGNVGTPERLDWTAIGDVVNTASRIEKGCTPGAILVSVALREAVRPAHAEIVFGEPFTLMVKGKRDAIAVCDLLTLSEPGSIK